MKESDSAFVDSPAVRAEVPLLIGIVGFSISGKTYSALRLATGMQRVVRSEIFVIDTEQKRALAYADYFKFRHVPISRPYGSLRYLQAIEYCASRGAKIIIVDQMSHEHSGRGGYLDMAEQFLLEKIKNEPENARRQKRPEKSEREIRGANSKTKWIIPADHRKKLRDGIVELGINGIFLYRAEEKMDDDFKILGWQPDTTSKLIYEFQQQFLLLPGCDGFPKFSDATESEKRLIKTPAQFRDWFKQGQRLDEAMGEKMARWAAGDESAKTVYGRLLGFATANGKSEAQLKAMLKAKGFKSAKQIPGARLQELCEALSPSPVEQAQAAPLQPDTGEAVRVASTQPGPIPTDQFTDRILVTAEDRGIGFGDLDHYIRHGQTNASIIEARLREAQTMPLGDLKEAIEKTLERNLF